MKIVVLSGDDTVASRERFFKIIDGIKKRGWEHVSLSPHRKLSEQLVGTSLFGGDSLYSIDAAAKVAPSEYEWLKNNADSFGGSLLLYFAGTAPAAIKKNLPKTTSFEEFKLKKELFVLLEAMVPKSSARVLKLFHTVIKDDAPELVLALLGRHVRDLAAVKEGSAPGIPEWRARKLSAQANRFSWDELKAFVHALSDADVKSKTGQGDIVVLLDLVFMKHLS